MGYIDILATKDCIAFKFTPNTNYNTTSLGIGKYSEDSDAYYRPFLYFPLSAINNLSAGAVISSIELYLYQYGGESAQLSFDAYRLITNWSETTLTWNNSPDSESTPTVTGLTCDDTLGWKHWPVTALIQECRSSTYYGIKLRAPNETINNGKSFRSREYSNGDYTPFLRVNYYTPPTAPIAPTATPAPFESALRLSWTKGNDGSSNPITGHEVQYQISDDGSVWSGQPAIQLGADDIYYDIPQAVIDGWPRGKYVQHRAGSKSEYSDTVYSGWSPVVRKNRVPYQPTSPSVPKTSYIPGETIRVSFANTGDADGNLAGFEVATDQDDTIVGTNNSGSASNIDVDTTGWEQGIQRKLRVRGYDVLGVRGPWSIYTAQITLNTAPLVPEISYPVAGKTVYNRRPHILLKASTTNDGPKHILCLNDGTEKTTQTGTGFSCGANDNLSSGQQAVYIPPVNLAAGGNNLIARMYDSFLYSDIVLKSFVIAAFAPTDPDLTVPGMPIKAIFFTELQTVVGNLLAAYGLPAVNWTQCVAQTTLIRDAAALIGELQTALQSIISRINGWDASTLTGDISVEWINPAAVGGGVDRIKLRQAIEQLRNTIILI